MTENSTYQVNFVVSSGQECNFLIMSS